MIKYMDNSKMITSSICSRWGIEKVREIWDIADHKETKFIMVQISENWKKAIEEWESKTSLSQQYIAVIYVDPITCTIESVGLEDTYRSEEKVIAFLIKRKNVMSNLGIMESKMQISKNLALEVFKSRYFFNNVNTWINDWNKESFETYTREELYGDTQNYLPIRTTHQPNTNLPRRCRNNQMERQDITRGLGPQHNR